MEEAKADKQQGSVSLKDMLAGFEDNPPPAVSVFTAAIAFIKSVLSSDEKNYLDTLDKLCRYLTWSLKQDVLRNSYISCGFFKEHSLAWIQHLKELLTVCMKTVANMKPDRVSDSMLLSVLLNTIVSLVSTQGWAIIHTDSYKHLEQGMSRLSSSIFSHLVREANLYGSIREVLLASLSRPGKTSLHRASLLALTSLANRPFLENKADEGLVVDYVRNILTVPGYIHYVQTTCPEGLNISMLPLLIETLEKEDNLISSLAIDDLNLGLSLLANLVEMGSYHESLPEIFHTSFERIISKLLNECSSKTKDQTKSHWHPILGWVSCPIPSSFLNAASIVKAQIEILWSPVYLEALFLPLRTFLTDHTHKGTGPRLSAGNLGRSSFKTNSVRNGIIKCFQKMLLTSSETASEPSTFVIKFNADITISTASACSLYSSLVKILPLCRLDILNGICFKCSSQILMFLWEFTQMLGGDSGLAAWVEFLLTNEDSKQECILVLLTDAMAHLITILDDQEIYEEQKIYKLEELADMALVVNNLCYRFISHPSYAKLNQNTLTSTKTLLMVLYRRDCRRRFCPDGHWLIESSKMHQLISDIEKCRRDAKRILLDMPHIVREENRIMFFRKWVQSEKALNGNFCGQHDLASTSGSALITIQRGRIVEDGYAHLANLSSKSLKGTIRVRFKNEYGLDEAGIDQDGVFKEFLEETIKAVFNPTLNLFKATSENLLYPSPLSYLHENHLELFEFVGKMLGKAVYEGIVVDVRFAPFFLSQILGLQTNTLFSLIDEIQSLDRDLYNSMNYIKHYQGDVKDLELFFSVDQDVLGELKTTEFMTGGRAVRVTNDNKISYLYYLARFHLYVEIKDQTAAFLRGFRSIISTEWLKIFSPSELQRLISGEDSDIDLVDLRRNTQYYGGFHDNHRVVVWFWEVLERDFTENERRLLLKFVTSCSKPPLLGFMNLEPPFSIRCVEVSEDEDTGDTIGSVVRGFLALGRREPIGRLPTSSTCFNLLKLPNYQRKSTLREKLRCAITSNVGFELS